MYLRWHVARKFSHGIHRGRAGHKTTGKTSQCQTMMTSPMATADVPQGSDGHDQHHKAHQLMRIDGLPRAHVHIRGQWVKNQDQSGEQHQILPFTGTQNVLGKVVHAFFSRQQNSQAQPTESRQGGLVHCQTTNETSHEQGQLRGHARVEEAASPIANANQKHQLNQHNRKDARPIQGNGHCAGQGTDGEGSNACNVTGQCSIAALSLGTNQQPNAQGQTQVFQAGYGGYQLIHQARGLAP